MNHYQGGTHHGGQINWALCKRSHHGEHRPWQMPSNNWWVQYSTVQYSTIVCIYIYILFGSITSSYSATHVCLFVSIVLYQQDQQYEHVLYQDHCHHDVSPRFERPTMTAALNRTPAALTNVNTNYRNCNRNTSSSSDHDDCGGSASNTTLNTISSSNNTMLDARNSNSMSDVIPIQLNPSTAQTFGQWRE